MPISSHLKINWGKNTQNKNKLEKAQQLYLTAEDDGFTAKLSGSECVKTELLLNHPPDTCRLKENTAFIKTFPDTCMS